MERKEKAQPVVVDGREIEQLVEDAQAFGDFVDRKFSELDADGNGRLSVSELQPAVADIGAALGLPARGSSARADHIYDEVLSEFTHGKREEEVSKAEFKGVLSDILLGMAAGLKRDPIVILRIDGEDLGDFVDGPQFDTEVAAIFSEISEEKTSAMEQCLIAGLQHLTVDNGMPPASDPWVVSNIVEPALEELSSGDAGLDELKRPVTLEAFVEAFKKFLLCITHRLQEKPAIVAHTANKFDGAGVRRLLENKFELDKLLDSAWAELPKDEHGTTASKEYLRVALDKMSASASLPPYGAVEQVDAVVDDAVKMAASGDGAGMAEDEFKKLLKEILGAMMLQLEGSPVAVETNTVIHDPLAPSASPLLPLVPPETTTSLVG